MTDFSKPQDPNQPPQGGYRPPAPGGYQPPPQGGFPPPQGGFPPPQGNYGPPGAAPPPAAFGGYPPAPVAGYGGSGAPPGFTIHPGSGLMLPDGVELASHGRRIGAWFLAIPLAVVTLVIGYLVWGLILWGSGTSPALKVLKMKVYRPDSGRKATFGTMALRDVVGVIVQGILSFITVLTSFILFLATGKRQSLPDLIASTVVVYDPHNILG